MKSIRCLLCSLLALCVAVVAQAQVRDVSIECEWGKLSATLAQPDEGSDTAIVIVAGSGPTDRYGNSAGMTTYSYKMLSDALVGKGFAVLSYDKRGVALSPIAAEDAPSLVLDDYVADAERCVEFLRCEGYRRVVMAGHSEGGTIALAVAAEQRVMLDGVVLLCAPGYTMDTILVRQLSAQLIPQYMGLMVKAEKIIRTLKAGEMIAEEDIPAELMSLFHPVVQPFVINSMSYDPQQLISRCTLPVVVISGGRDIQVTVDNGRALCGAQPAASHVVFEDMTHVLKSSATSDRVEQIMSIYTNGNLPLTEGLVDAIAEFINNKI